MDAAGERRQYHEMDDTPRRNYGEEIEGSNFRKGVKDPQHQEIVRKGNWLPACVAR
jgi:hypothetical protein